MMLPDKPINHRVERTGRETFLRPLVIVPFGLEGRIVVEVDAEVELGGRGNDIKTTFYILESCVV